MAWSSANSASGETFLGGTGVHSECGVRHSLCKCWDDEDDYDDEYEEEDDE